MTDSHDHRREELAAYLLGALGPAEAAAFEHHVERCERCREELRRLAPAVRALPETVERREPPPGLRRRLLAEIRADAATDEDGAPRGRVAWLHHFHLGPLGPRPLIGLTVLALVVAAIAGYAIGSGGGTTRPPTATFHSGRAPGVVAEVRREGTAGRLRLANVRPLPRGRVLEAWVRRNGTVEPVRGLFAPDRRGDASTTLGDLTGVDMVMVTVEPAGGTPAPTTSPITSVKIG